MKRDKWEFQYSGDELLAACKVKIEHHQARLTWWEDQKKLTMEKVKAEGISIEESIGDRKYGGQTRMSAGASNPWDDERDPQIRVRIDLQRDLTESSRKIREHTEKLQAYRGWEQVFGAPTQSLYARQLDYDDWLYFFGQTSKTPEW